MIKSMRRVIFKVVVPLLFVVVGSVASLFAVDFARCAWSHNEQPASESEKWIISPYDRMFQEMGERYGIDWLLLSAIARVESEFKADAVSPVGAVGIMQVMPHVAKRMGYERESLLDPQICTEVAALLLLENNNMLSLSKSFDETERLNFILACYNAGYSRIADARRLARFHDEDHNKWSVVEEYLELLAEPEFAEHEVVESGLFCGSEETRNYVQMVMRRYRQYKEKIKAEGERDVNS